MNAGAAPSRTARDILLLCLLATVLFADVLFFENNFFQRDLFRYQYPMKKIVREIIAGGEFPSWNRYFSNGQPMAANPAYEIFYPPQWLIFVGSYDFGFTLHILAHVYLALAGMYLLLRALNLRANVAVFGALSFGLSGYFLGLMSVLPILFLWAWMPLALWAAVRWIQWPSPSRFVITAMIMAIQMLVGEPMGLLQCWAILGLALIIGRRQRGVAAGALLLLIAISLAAVQVLPGIDHARDSVRSRGFEYSVVIDYSMPVARPLELVVPRMFGILDPQKQSAWGMALFSRHTPFLLSISCGVAIAILVLGGFIARARGSLAVVAVCVISYVLAIGDATPLYRWLYDAGVRSLRYPEKFFEAAVFVLVIFAALVAERFLDGDVPTRRGVRIAAYVVTAMAVAPLLMTPAMFQGVFHPKGNAALLFSAARAMWLIGAAITAGWALLASLHRQAGSRAWSLAALLLLFADVVWLGREASPSISRDLFTPPNVVGHMLSDHYAYTIFHRGEWDAADANRRAYRGAMPPWILARNALQPLSAATWGFRTALELDYDETALLPTHEVLDALMRSGNGGQIHWAEPFLSAANVRYILDYRDIATDMRESAGDLLESRPVTVKRIPNRGSYYFQPANGRVLNVSETSNTAVIDVEATSPALLNAAVTRHKYWSATIDGHDAPIVPAFIAYQAINVPPGKHRIELRYRNPLIAAGAALSGMTLAACLIVLITTPIRRRRRLRSGS